MGSQDFQTDRIHHDSAREAFAFAREIALEYGGHRDGYSGNIAAKGEFVVVHANPGESTRDAIERIMDLPKFDSSWGPAAALEVEPGQWVFFGWAPC